MNAVHEIIMDKACFTMMERHRNLIFGAFPILESLTYKIEGTKDLWEHTKKVCHESPTNHIVRWAALFHDVGKPIVYNLHKGSLFANHDTVGAKEWREASKRVGSTLSEEDITRIETLIRLHMHIGQYQQAWKDKAVRKMIESYNGDIKLGIALASADGWDYYLSDQLQRRICHL